MVWLTDRPDMTLDVYRGRKSTTKQQQKSITGSLHQLLQNVNLSVSGYIETQISKNKNRVGEKGAGQGGSG